MYHIEIIDAAFITVMVLYLFPIIYLLHSLGRIKRQISDQSLLYIEWWLLFYRRRLNAQYIEINELPTLFQNCFPGQFVAMSDGIKEFYGFISPMQRMRCSLSIIFWDGNEKDYALGEDKKYIGNFSQWIDGTIRNDRIPNVKLVGIEKFDFSISTKQISYRTKRVCYILEKIFWEKYENVHAHQQHYLV